MAENIHLVDPFRKRLLAPPPRRLSGGASRPPRREPSPTRPVLPPYLCKVLRPTSTHTC